MTEKIIDQLNILILCRKHLDAGSRTKHESLSSTHENVPFFFAKVVTVNTISTISLTDLMAIFGSIKFVLVWNCTVFMQQIGFILTSTSIRSPNFMLPNSLEYFSSPRKLPEQQSAYVQEIMY